MSSNNGITQVQIVKDPLWRRIIRNPFKFYCRAGGITFCAVAATNFATSLFDTERMDFLLMHPQLFFTGLLFKSTQFGLIWPSFYMTAVTNPRAAFILGGGIQDAIEKSK